MKRCIAAALALSAATLTPACGAGPRTGFDDMAGIDRPRSRSARRSASDASADADGLGRELTLDALVRVAKLQSPGIEERRMRADALLARADREGALPPPELKAEAWGVPLERPLGFSDAMMLMVGVQQSIPAPGVRGGRAEAAEWDARAAREGARGAELDVEQQAARAFWAYALAERELALHREHHALVADLLEATRTAYSVRRATQADLFVVELELGEAEIELARGESALATAAALVNALAGREPDAPLGPPRWEPARKSPDVAALAAQQDGGRPELAAARHAIQRARAAERAARRASTWPSFMVGLDYMNMPGDEDPHGYGAMVSMSLPWLWGGGRAEERAASRERAADELALESIRRAARYELAAAAAEARAAQRALEAYDQRLVPAAERAAKAAGTGFSNGQVSPATLVAALERALEVRIARVRARAALGMRMADVDRAVGARAEGSRR